MYSTQKKQMSENTNALVLFTILGGFFYLKNISSLDENQEIQQNIAPILIAAVVIFSMKKEIEASVTRERLYTFTAVLSSSYLISTQASMLHIFGSTFLSLILLPALLVET